MMSKVSCGTQKTSPIELFFKDMNAASDILGSIKLG